MKDVTIIPTETTEATTKNMVVTASKKHFFYLRRFPAFPIYSGLFVDSGLSP